MEQKQLTNDQIKELHKLVERNAINYYDVEIEIVDHYATAREAKERIYKEFWDFKGLQKKKEKVLSDLAQREINLKLRTAFSWPKIMIFFLLTIFFYSIGTQIQYKAGLVLGTSLSLILIAYILYKVILIKKLEKQLDKRFLRLKTIALQHNSITLLLLIPMGMFESLPMPIVIFSASLAFTSIFIFISIKIVQTELSHIEKQFS